MADKGVQFKNGDDLFFVSEKFKKGRKEKKIAGKRNRAYKFSL